MKATSKLQRVALLLKRARAIKGARALTVDNLRDDLNTNRLHPEDSVSYATVIKWMKPDFKSNISGECALALQEWVKANKSALRAPNAAMANTKTNQKHEEESSN